MAPNYNPDSMDAALSRIETKLDDALARLDKHDARITTVETRSLLAMGGALLLSFLASLGFDFLRR